MKLRPYQEDALKDIREIYAKGTKKVLLHLATGGGKCHAAGTKILLHDGSIKLVEDVNVGDLLMGPDSKPRRVLSLARGSELLYKIVPTKGETWGCNESHVLSLKDTTTGGITNIRVKDYLKQHKTFKHTKKLYRVGVEFPSSVVEFDPYIVGVYLAEGSAGCPQITNPDQEIISYVKDWADSIDLNVRDEQGAGCRELSFSSKTQGWFRNKADKLRKMLCTSSFRDIPKQYLINSREVRLQLLAGLLDGDGYLHHNGYEITTKHKELNDSILFLARSLGFSAYSSYEKKAIKKLEFEGYYYRIYIAGHVDEIPCKVQRKIASPRLQKKDCLRTGFKLEAQGVGEYFGFELDGDHLYLLGDFTVTHNTLIFCTILKSAHEKGKKALMVVRGKNLVDQASKRLDREGVDHGVIMAGHWRNRPNLNLQVASIDTLYARRGSGLPFTDADLIVIDEAHYAVSTSFKWLVSVYADSYCLGVTATPHVKAGLRHIADEVVYPITIRELIAQKFLVAPEYYAPASPDLKGVRIDKKTGDYALNDLSSAMSQPNLYGDMVKSYLKYASNLPALLFCVSVEHSQQVCEVFNKEGIKTEHLDGTTPTKQRDEILARLESGETKVVTNIGVLTTGVDIPCLKCIILARPTKSYNLYIQIMGRGTRPFPGKERFIVLDHSNAVSEHGFIENERTCDLDGKSATAHKLPPICTCKQCYHVFDPAAQYEEKNLGAKGRDYLCEMCGFDNTPERAKTERVVDESVELKKIDEALIGESPIQFDIRKLVTKAVLAGYKPGWVYHKVREKHGDLHAKGNFQFIKRLYNEAAINQFSANRG